MNDDPVLRKMFETLIDQHASMLVSYLASFAGSKSEAEDLAQETFLKAYLNFERYDSEKGNFPAWLRTIGRNLAIDVRRRSGKVVSVDPEVLEGIEEVYCATDGYGKGDCWNERMEPLRECIQQLSDPLRKACDLFYFKSLSGKAVAGRLKVDLQTVLKRLQRAREFLGRCIEGKLGLESVEMDQ